MTTSNFNRNLVQTLQETFIKNIRSRMTDRGIIQIEFKTPFRIYAEESSYNDDYVKVPLAAYSMFRDGNVLAQNENGDDESFKIESLDIYDLAYIMDVLESGDYTVEEDDEEFIDPAGGRGLESHI